MAVEARWIGMSGDISGVGEASKSFLAESFANLFLETFFSMRISVVVKIPEE